MSVECFKIPGSRLLKGKSEKLIKENLNYINKNKKKILENDKITEASVF